MYVEPMMLVAIAASLALAAWEIYASNATSKAAELARDEAESKYHERAGLVVSLDKQLEESRAARRILIREKHGQANANQLIGKHLDDARGRLLELEGAIHDALNKRDAAEALAQDRLEAIHAAEEHSKKCIAGRDAASARATGYARKVDELEGRVKELQDSARELAKHSKPRWSPSTTDDRRDVLVMLEQSAILCDVDEAKAQQAAADRKEVVRLNDVVKQLNGEIQQLKKGLKDEAKLRADAQAIYDGKERDFNQNLRELRAKLERQAKRLEEGEFTVTMASVRGELARVTTARDEAQAQADRLRKELEGVAEHTTRLIDQRNEAREGCKALWEKLEKWTKAFETIGLLWVDGRIPDGEKRS